MLSEKTRGRIALIAAIALIVPAFALTAYAEVSSPSKWKISGGNILPKLGSWGISLPVGGVASKGFDITIADTINDVGLTVTQNDTTNNPDAVQITNTGTGKDILGTSSSWNVTKGGAATFIGNATLGKVSGLTGKLSLVGTTSGTVMVSAADAAGAWTMTLPATDGNASEYLQTDGAGNTVWAAAGGMTNPMDGVGNLIYGGAAGAATKLASDVSDTRKFLRTLSIGGVAQAPAWDTLTASDVSLGSVENTALSTWAGSSNITTIGTLTGLAVDGKTTLVPSADQARLADSAVDCTDTLTRVVGSGGAVILDLDPAVADGTTDGQFCVIQGTSDTNTVLIADNVNTQLAGGNSFTLAQGNMLTLIWDAGDSMWYEQSRSAN